MRTVLLAALFLLAACPKPAPPPPPPPVEEPAPERKEPDAGTVSDLTAVTAAERSCEANADCVLITEDCCGCNGGGKQVAVRKDAVAALVQRRTPICAEIVCSQQLSDDPSCDARKARCMEGHCVADFPGAKAPAGVAVEKIGD